MREMAQRGDRPHLLPAPGRLAAVAALLVLLPPAGAQAPATWDPVAGRQRAVEALGLYQRADAAAARDGFRRALELQHDHLEFLQFLAGAEERLGHGAAALAALERIHRLGFDLAFDPPDEWVARVVARPDYQKIRTETAPLRAPLVKSSEAFRIDERRLIPEGLAWDAKKSDFFVSSVRERRILRRRADGKVEDFAPAGAEGTYSVLGLAVDPVRRRLWAATTAYPPMEGYRDELEGRSALLAFDLESGRQIGRYEAAAPGKKGFNDVGVAPDGAVFVTDHEERPGTLYRLDPQSLKLAPFGDRQALGSPEGLTFSADGRYLFVADYSYGIVRYELATGRHLYLADPPGSTLIGIDHLSYYRGALIAVQNGNRPSQVLRLPLAPEADRILAAEVLERDHPAYSDPTLGVVVGDDLYYLATSNWGRLDAENRLPPAAELAPVVVLRLPLGGG